MKCKAWDVWIDNCFMQRVHYMGMLQMIEQRYRNSGHLVKVVEVEIDC